MSEAVAPVEVTIVPPAHQENDGYDNHQFAGSSALPVEGGRRRYVDPRLNEKLVQNGKTVRFVRPKKKLERSVKPDPIRDSLREFARAMRESNSQLMEQMSRIQDKVCSRCGDIIPRDDNAFSVEVLYSGDEKIGTSGYILRCKECVGKAASFEPPAVNWRQGLSPDERTVLELCEVEGLTQTQAAERMFGKAEMQHKVSRLRASARTKLSAVQQVALKAEGRAAALAREYA